ncbi:lytic transglycosylase domain-containing protein [Chakrabartyella piscis]|uniref:lytic transglycosylase domain-containing protein n=1 Tax=Chakrabartyella piscis TaxID=2918914 RepID=UPI002958B5E3|nr:lytic transglycosylase domain-containing protein [Chakrabartyella piscis]
MIRFMGKAMQFLAFCMVIYMLYQHVFLPKILPKYLPIAYEEQVEHYADAYDLEESLVYAVIFCESGFNPEAISSAGAIGLMQVTEETGWWAAGYVGMDADTVDLTDPDTNIAIGSWYLHWLIERFGDDLSTVLAGYNAGHGKVASWLDSEEYSQNGTQLDAIPFPETDKYVKKVQVIQKLYELFW